MKIARIVENYPSSSEKIDRGLLPNIHYLSKLQSDMGNEVTVYTTREGNQPTRDERDGVQIVRVKKPRMRRTFLELRVCREIRRRGDIPDIVHSLNPLPLGWLIGNARRILPASFALSVHGSLGAGTAIGGPPSLEKFFIYEFRRLTIGVAPGVDLVLPVSSFIRREVELLGVEPEKMQVIPSGVNTRIFVPKKREFNMIPRVLFVSRFSLGKGLPYLIKAAGLLRRNHHFRILMVGGTPQDNGYGISISMIRDLGLRDIVEVRPPVPHSNLPEIYSAHDMSVLPSEKEALGKVLLEAMACGRPVISTRSGGITDIVDDGKTGLLVPPRNPGALAEALLELIEDEGKRNRMGSLARRKAIHFEWKSIAQRHLEAFRSIID